MAVLVALLAGCDKLLGLSHVDNPPAPPDALAPGNWSAVATGYAHTCALQLDGSLWCWGRNEDGELGLGTMAPEVGTPTHVGGASWLEISTGAWTTCGIQVDHSLWCWGRGLSGQLGPNAQPNERAPHQVPGSWTHVSTNNSHTCAIAGDQTMWCWGSNTYGELGNGTLVPVQTATPQPVAGSAWVEVATSIYTSCGIDASHVLRCWGTNVGDGTSANRSSPVVVPAGECDHVAASGAAVCALRSDGRLRCWGNNDEGNLGDSTTTSAAYPVVVGDDSADWTQVGVGDAHACAIRADGSLWCWGDNGRDELGIVASQQRLASTPTPVDVGHVVWTSIAPGYHHTCGITEEHNLWCVGGDGYGQQGDTPAHRVPLQVAGTWRQPAASGADTCALDDATGALWCWGNNDSSQLGDTTTAPREVPVQVAGGSHGSIAIGLDDMCEVRGTDRWCWGMNIDSIFGDGTGLPAVVPEQIRDAQAWKQLAGPALHMCGVASGQALFCWGYNGYHQVANDSNVFHSSPTQVPGTWAAVAAGALHTCALASTSSLWCWGQNGNYQIGDGTTIQALSPKQVNPVVLPIEIHAAGNSTCVLGSMGEIACWGDNTSGQLTGSAMNVTTPTVLSGVWRQLALGEDHTCAITFDRTLWCWGADNRGQLGDGADARQNAPVQISAEPVWEAVAVGSGHSCATKSDHTLWCWGDNEDGELGIGSAWHASFTIIPAP